MRRSRGCARRRIASRASPPSRRPARCSPSTTTRTRTRRRPGRTAERAMARLRIATRGSALAVAPSSLVAQALARALGVETELVRIRTEGDRLQHAPPAAVGGKGLFVKELEEALLDGRADLAVHSAKDLPAKIAPGLALAAFPERGDARDALVGSPLDALRPGA